MTNSEDLNKIGLDLAKSVERLTTESDDHFAKIQKTYRLNRRLIYAVVIGLVLDITVSIFLAVGFVQLGSTQDGLQHVTDRIDFSQTVTRRQVLCPLYRTFLASDSPEARAAFQGGQAKYDQLFDQLNRSYNALDCEN